MTVVDELLSHPGSPAGLGERTGVTVPRLARDCTRVVLAWLLFFTICGVLVDLAAGLLSFLRETEDPYFWIRAGMARRSQISLSGLLSASWYHSSAS